MPDTDPLSEVLTALPSTSAPRAPAKPYKTKKGVLEFQPDASDWSLDRLPEIESAFLTKFNKPLPVRNRGQGAIHNRLGYKHDDSADISLHPDTPEGQFVVSEFQRRGYPFLAFKGAIPGVSTGPHIHGGWPSKRTQRTQSPQFASRPQRPSDASDPLSQVLTELPAATPQPSVTPEHRDPFAEASSTLAQKTQQPEQPATPAKPALTRRQRQQLAIQEESAGQYSFTDPHTKLRRYVDNYRQLDAALTTLGVKLRTPSKQDTERPLYEAQQAEPLVMPPVGGRGAGMARASVSAQAERTGQATTELPDLFQEMRDKVISEAGGSENYQRAIREATQLGQTDRANMIQQKTEAEVTRRVSEFSERLHRVELAEAGQAPQLGLWDKIRELGDSPAQLLPFISSGPEIAKLLRVGAAAQKLENLEKQQTKGTKFEPGGLPTQDDIMLLREFHAEQNKDTSLLYKVADTASMLPAFVGEFAATGGAFKIGKEAALEGLKRVATKKGIERIEKNLAGRLATKSVSALGGAALQTIPAGATRIPAGVLYREQEGADFATALRDTLTDQFIEVASERSGGLLSHIPLPKRLSAIRDAVTARWIAKAPGRTAAQLKQIVDKTGWHGPLGEIFEERVGDVARYATGLQKSPVPSLEQVAVEGLAFSIPGVSLAVANKALSRGARSEGMSQAAPTVAPVASGDVFTQRPDTRTPEAPAVDPLAEVLAGIKIVRAEEPYAGPAEFRGMAEGDLYDLASRRPPKGTTRQKRLEIIRTQAAAIAELDRRQNEGQPAEVEPRDTGIRAESGDVPSFQEYVENRPQGGTRFETLEPGSPDYNELAGEYVDRYGTRERATQPAGAREQALGPATRTKRPLTTRQPSVDLPAIESRVAELIRTKRAVPDAVYSSEGIRGVLGSEGGDISQLVELGVIERTPEGHYTFNQNIIGAATEKRIAKPVEVKGIPTKAKATREELPPVETVSVGRETQAVTERGSEISTRYAVVGLDSLITSHDSALRPNPNFPPELQPRERDRAASADQISRIASNLRPDFLGESPKASEGAPIVGPDGIVESGNGRVLAIRQAYEAAKGPARNYRGYLRENAERLGLDPQAVQNAKRPVLIRIRTSEVDRAQFVKEANEQSIASMSPVEQARSDATSLKGGLLDLFRPSDTGEIATSANLNFVRAFMKDVVGPNEVNRYVTASGQVSQEGISRIRNAIFARAYGDSPQGLIALEKLAESTDNNVRNITTAMLRNASGFASLKEGIEQGTRYELDLAPDVSAAMSKMSSLRDQGMPVPDYLRQGALYGEDLSPIQKRVLQVFDENKRGANTIDAILRNYLRGSEAAGSPTQAGLFGTETPSKEDFLEAAIKEATHGQVSASLFETLDQGLQSQPAQRGKDTAVNTRESARPFRPTASDITGEQSARETEPTNEDEAGGRPLGRFDSTIDRLKGYEELARQRLAERSAEAQKLFETKRSERGATTIPQDLYDYVVIGASKLAQRSLSSAQFIDELVREFGESIRKHARAIFRHSQKMVADTEKEIRAERVSQEIADRLFTENVPRDQQRRALRIAAQFRTTTDTQGKLLSGFKSRVGEMAKSYGAAGGELTNRVHLGDIARGHEMEAGNKFLSRIQDVYEDIKNDFERQRISDSVINALEDRGNADRYLDTPEKKSVYENTVEMLDMFRDKLNALGYETRPNYFTHIRDVDILDQILSDAQDPKDVSLNDLVAAKSRFLQPRVDARSEIKKDLPRVLHAYLKSVTKEIAYIDAVEYYYGSFLDDIPIGLRRHSMDRAIKLMQNSLKPEQGRGQFFRVIGRLRSEQYRNFLGYNLKASAMNFTQVDFARMRWTKEASKLSSQLWRKRKTITGPLADAIDVASTKETPLMRFLEQFKGDEPRGTRGRFAEAFNKYDPFQRSEGRNWGMTELGSIINSAVKRPEYKAAKARHSNPVDAINEVLAAKKEYFDAAVREAATTAAETQVAANPAARGEFYDVPLHRIIGMFTAFKTRQLQMLGEALRSHEGIDGARAQTILRRGLSGDAQPVEVLREIEAFRKAMEKMVQRAAKFKEDLGIPRRQLNTMIAHLKTQEKELNGIIKRIEPLSGGRARSTLLVAKYFAKVGAIAVFFNLFWDSVYSAMAGPEEEEKDAEERLSTALSRAFWDILPSPFYGGNPSKFLVSPVAPNFERSAPFGKMTRRGLARDIVSYGATVIPFAGVVDRATNRRLSGAVVDLAVPKQERKKAAQR